MLGDRWNSELPALMISGPALSAKGPSACIGAGGAPDPAAPEPPLKVLRGRSGREDDGSAYADSSAANARSAYRCMKPTSQGVQVSVG